MNPIKVLDQPQKFFPTGVTKNYAKDYLLCDTHKKVETVHWLVSGTISFYLTKHELDQEILVSQTAEPYTIIGWNGLTASGRYTYRATIASEEATFFEIPLRDFKAYLTTSQDNELLRYVCANMYHQLKYALLKQTELLHPRRADQPVATDEFFVTPEASKVEIVALMRRSPFLDTFSEGHLSLLAEYAERRDYEPGEVLYLKDRKTNGLYILIDGEVIIQRIEGNVDIRQRSISNSGFIFGWSGLIDERDVSSAVTAQKTSAYFIPHTPVLELLQSDFEFGKAFFLRLVWLIGNQINVAFLRYVSLLGKFSIEAVYQLIENNRSRLNINSPLHQIFHLLQNLNTKSLGYALLRQLLSSGTALERHIASLSLEFLKNDQKETRFLKGLHAIYETVAETHASKSTEIIRKACAEATKKLFEPLHVHLEGLENLPETSGNIFIYNHLYNPRYYTLNNNFQITLDSHFISAMVLDAHYGEPGIRTVRIGRGQEYGHQNYYDNLGYINVFTKESENIADESSNAVKSIFYRKANEYLDQNYNLIISPEGTSYSTEESPGPFKMGAFNLAFTQEPEPYIVPVVLANFDKRILDNLFYCKILKPFKVREKMTEMGITDLKEFVLKYQELYAGYVEEARIHSSKLLMTAFSSELTEDPPAIWRNEIKRLRRRVDNLENQDDLVVFYGSSTIRLWVTMQRDLESLNVLNLGFGGSTYAWCLHYFERIFEGVNPSKIVLYAGENDIANENRTPLEVLADLKELVKVIYAKYPNIELAIISLKPSLERKALIPQFMETSELISRYTITELNAQFINVFSHMITVDDTPMPDLYMSDGLHLNKKGYNIWKDVIAKSLLNN